MGQVVFGLFFLISYKVIYSFERIQFVNIYFCAVILVLNANEYC